MDLESCYKIGYVLKPHGLKGEVTVSIDPDIPNDFSVIESVFLEKNKQLIPYFVDYISVKGSKAYVKFEDVDSHEAAIDISKQSIYLPKSARPKSARGEFYDDEVKGFTVQDQNLGDLGSIEDVMIAGANRLLILNHDGKEVLIPINSPFIVTINKSKKRISTNLPDGFLDI